MTTAELTAGGMAAPTMGSGFGLWLRQALAIFRIEFGKAMFSRKSFGLDVLAFGPVLIFLFALYESYYDGEPAFDSIEEGRRIFGYMYSALILGGVIYLGCAYMFSNLFRGEILDRSIHYYLLSPVRREVLVTGKFLAGYAAALLMFGGSTLICMFLMYMQFGMGRLVTDITNGIAIAQVGQYLGI
ncbi:MAG: ABC transporter permease subunit, partial [Gammaproteobacteria bacterium]